MGGTDEKDEAAVDFLRSEFVTLAGQLERGLGPLFIQASSPRGSQCAVEGLSPLEAVERLGEGTAIGREVVPLDEPHAERKERVVVIHDPEEVARIPLGKDLYACVLCVRKSGAGGHDRRRLGRDQRAGLTERTYRTTGLSRSRSWSVHKYPGSA